VVVVDDHHGNVTGGHLRAGAQVPARGGVSERRALMARMREGSIPLHDLLAKLFGSR
jgi:hypothetical protein